MIIIMNSGVTDEQVDAVVNKIRGFGLDANISRGTERTVIGAIGDERKLEPEMFDTLPGVEYSMHIVKQYKIVSRESHKHDSVINIGGARGAPGVALGGNQIQVIGGPCSVETQQQMDLAAQQVAAAGCRLMRGGAFKPRTSPYTFQGKGEEGLGRANKPVILKRGMSATISEWLMAAEYIAAGGNHNIIFCERGIRSFETAYRNVMDVTCIPVLKKETHLPVIVDPSHAGGKAWMVPALARAAIAAGADGLLVEMHPNPCEAWCDADQALNPQEFKDLMGSLKGIAEVIGRSM